MNRQEQIGACARFRGIELIDGSDARGYGIGRTAPIYNPFADTPEGREQANELWRTLASKGYRVLHADSEQWWNSALSTAVAELQVSLEAAIPPDQNKGAK